MSKSYSAIALVALALGLMVAGCGSSSSSSSGETGAETTASSGGGAYSSPSSGTEETASEEVTSETASSAGAEATPISVGTATGVGKVLVDSNGMTLYYFQKDQKGSGKSKCEGACESAWPPLTTGGEAEAMAGVNASMLGTIERSDGTMQVTYNGLPLYTFAGDQKPGEANGNDIKAFGGEWYALKGNGEEPKD